MANAVNQNPLVIDTAAGFNAVASGNQNVRTIILTAPTNNAQYLLIDAQSKTMFAIDSWNQGTQSQYEWPNERPLSFAGGITVASCSAGRLLIYLF